MYEDFADAFAVHAEHGAYNAHYDRPAVLALLGDVAGLRILDVGCGSGLYAAELIERGAAVVGFDGSARLVQLARQRVGSVADLRVHDVRDPLDWLGAESVDAAVMALVLHHLDDPIPALREVHRVLRPGGRLVVSTVHPVADWRQLGGSYFTDEMVEDTWNAGWRVRFRRAPLTRWCDEFFEAGFLIERLVEPLPAEAMKARFPDTCDKLTVEPFFIAFVLSKTSSTAASRQRS